MTATVLAAMAFAGCTQGPDVDPTDGTPIARLTATPETTTPGETVRFDATESTDPNGEIETFAIDFGDGTTDTFGAAEAGAIEHTYDAGGAYTVTLSVTDDGANQEEPLTGDTTLVVAVQDSLPFSHTVANTQPINTTEAQTDADELVVRDGAERFHLDANVSAASPVHNAEIRLSLVAPSGAVVAERTVTLAPGAATNVTLDGALMENGTYLVHSEALSGAADVEGLIEVYYATEGTDDADETDTA